MATIDHHQTRSTAGGPAGFFSVTSLVLLAVAALAIGTMVLGGVIGIFSGGEETPIASNDEAPVIGVNDPNIVVEEPSGAEVAPLSSEAQGTTMTTVPTTPVDETE